MSPTFVDNDAKFDWRKFGYHARSAFAVLLSAASSSSKLCERSNANGR